MSLVAITVSTNYSDLLPYTVKQNLQFFKKWIFVTDIADIATIDYLSNFSNVIVLHWDFKNSGRVFDKGGALRYAQSTAYALYPDDWYVVLDSDICLSNKFKKITSNLQALRENAIYGALRRWDYRKLSDYLFEKNHFEYPWGDQLQGYFQLYKQHQFYSGSNDASGCDLEFVHHFAEKHFFSEFVCFHLGHRGNWSGRALGADFDVDVKLSAFNRVLHKLSRLTIRY